ncbi:DUF3558 domain-containing protein [Streptomyces sp. XM4193]|uniref:DUF3558 domain-containing protein n=1 Tax=Streptomyces sp. XM4193 TaxID=2929782 RepID=UPI001FF8D90E|nr:DUF3558 domain-containing protein [Streptomyces sp. XM4193]MCK1796587.1 DUF3558 domain-containing protein [Streptomyces sp. XM4193]
MQRRARRSATAALIALTLGLTGCTGGSDGEDEGDGKSGGSSQTGPAKPGTHASLPEPCGAVSEETLRELLVADGAESASPTNRPLPEGTAAVTYDIERRVGCKWKSTGTLGSHHLSIDLERVVSYDGEISDDDRAAELYDARARKDKIPDEAPPVDEDSEEDENSEDSEDSDGDGSTEDAEPDGAGNTPDDEDTGGSEEPQGGEDGTGPSDDGSADATDPADPDDPAADPALVPRPLEAIGDVAYLNDELVTADSGLHRDITLVFRAGNVIVTVEYDQWSTDKRLIPGSEELQEKAQKLAKQLVGQLEN